MDNQIYEKNLRRLTELRNDDHHAVRIAFCGKFKSGKSSLLNLLLDASLPVKSTTATGTITKILYGRHCAIMRQDGSLQNVPASEIGKYISIQEKRLDGVSVSSAQYAYVGSRAKLLQRGKVEFWDTPGLEDDPTLSRITMDALEKCDMVVYVMHANQVLSQYEKRILPQLHKKMGGNILFVINHIDELHGEDVKTVAEYVRSGLGKYKNSNYTGPNILLTSAKPGRPQIGALHCAIQKICGTKQARLNVITSASRSKAQYIQDDWLDFIRQDTQDAQSEKENYAGSIQADIAAKRENLCLVYEKCTQKTDAIQKALVDSLQDPRDWRLVLLNYQKEKCWEEKFVTEAPKRIKARLNELVSKTNSDMQNALSGTFLETDTFGIQLNEALVWQKANWYKNFSRPLLFPEKRFRQYAKDCVDACIYSVMTFCIPRVLSGIAASFDRFRNSSTAHYKKAILEVHAEESLTQGLQQREAELSAIQRYQSQLMQLKEEIDSGNLRRSFLYRLRDALAWLFPGLLNRERFA